MILPKTQQCPTGIGIRMIGEREPDGFRLSVWCGQNDDTVGRAKIDAEPEGIGERDR